MKLSRGPIIALVFLATCTEETQEPDSPNIEPSVKTIGKVPASEVATWQKVGSANTPDGRYLQAAAYDETRKVIVIFGGATADPNSFLPVPNKQTWEWSPTTGEWTNRTVADNAPDARSGASMVYDSQRQKFLLFGGRAGSGLNFEDTWEWEPTTGVWTNISGPGDHPSARSQAAMVYQKSTGKIFLFGGGRSDPNAYDGAGMTKSLGDTWEFDPTTGTWRLLSTPVTPTPRHDMGAAWDSIREKVVVFGGMQTEIAGASGVPKQDTWEWDSATSEWSERTTSGSKPSQRYAHSMAFDSTRGRVMVFGGFDIATGGFLSDLWEWDPTGGTWSNRGATTASDNWPSGREYASMVAIEGSGRLEMVAGLVLYDPFGKGGTGGMVPGPFPGYYGTSTSREVWELEPATASFTNRTTPLNVPSPRSNHAMAYYPVTGKVYLFGGRDSMMFQALGDLWEWDGSTWTLVAEKGPSPRADAALAYDPVRKSLILFGGSDQGMIDGSSDTWEWTNTNGWQQLKTVGAPVALIGPGMVTDTVHNKILLFGGLSYASRIPPYGTGGFIVMPPMDPFRNEVWEWDGASLTWTNRTPTTASQAPRGRQYPTMVFDDARGKLFLYDGEAWSSGMATSSAFWEWDPDTGGWALRDPGDWLKIGYNCFAAYDSIRRREVFLSPEGVSLMWELDTRGPTWYERPASAMPEGRSNTAMVFDVGRGVVVLFGGMSFFNGLATNDTWEYRVANWGNGTGCTSEFASSCASGYCVDGVCCASATCTGPCQSCSVAGSEGTCIMAKPGTVVPGSCDQGQACDGKGNCLGSNGQPCAGPSTCASGYCTDGVCCEHACTGPCVACAMNGKEGKCTPYTMGTDPESECGKGEGVCKSTCDGVGACVFPSSGQPCDSCMVCDGNGTCTGYDPFCRFTGGGGAGGSGGSGGYYTTARGGSGGYYTTARGGSGGYYTTARGGSGGYYTTARGGSGGSGGYYTTARGGSGGWFVGSGGSGGYYTTARGGSGGWFVGSGGSGGYYTTARGGSGGWFVGSGGSAVGGAGGKADGGPKDSGVGGRRDGGEVLNLRLHRSGCDCALGSTRDAPATGLMTSLLGMAAVLLWRSRRRRR